MLTSLWEMRTNLPGDTSEYITVREADENKAHSISYVQIVALSVCFMKILCNRQSREKDAKNEYR
jgi:hypothetical protein